MKKIIFILLFIGINILSVIKVNAQTFYSNYTDVLLNNDKYEVQSIKMYRFYKEEMIGEYININEEKKYPYVEEDNLKYLDYSEYKDVCDKNKDIKYTEFYPYRELKTVKYVKVYNNSRSINISNIKIFDDKKEIDYEIIDSLFYLSNNLNTNGFIVLKLNSDISYDKFNIIIGSSDYSRLICFKVYNNLEKELADVATLTNGNNKLTIDNIPLSNYGDIIYSEKKISKTDTNLIYDSITKCQERDIQIYNYDIVRKYYDGYHEDVTGYIKDEEDYKMYYRYVLDDSQLNKINDLVSIFNEKVDTLKGDINKSLITNNDKLFKEISNIHKEEIIDDIETNDKEPYEYVVVSDFNNNKNIDNNFKIVILIYILLLFIIGVILIWRKKSVI